MRVHVLRAVEPRALHLRYLTRGGRENAAEGVGVGGIQPRSRCAPTSSIAADLPPPYPYPYPLASPEHGAWGGVGSRRGGRGNDPTAINRAEGACDADVPLLCCND